jgi:hypothetical protein
VCIVRIEVSGYMYIQLRPLCEYLFLLANTVIQERYNETEFETEKFSADRKVMQFYATT